MIMAANGNWIANFENFTCWNCVHKLSIAFENNGNTLKGKIKDMPLKLMEKWALDPYGSSYMKQMIQEAEEHFLRAYYENAGTVIRTIKG